ncbi:hypothetical protein OPT61_g4241 [Boeremia exigua]|uniref:Uncharacterized protein n=1 Tax=Boeremia exigua TaxID=749465 RepID=A0ACC2IEN6_9PLEO|nr:hypothetical protein OPT61_g4241 [Boeremia exigua]
MWAAVQARARLLWVFCLRRTSVRRAHDRNHGTRCRQDRNPLRRSAGCGLGAGAARPPGGPGAAGAAASDAESAEGAGACSGRVQLSRAGRVTAMRCWLGATEARGECRGRRQVLAATERAGVEKGARIQQAAGPTSVVVEQGLSVMHRPSCAREGSEARIDRWGDSGAERPDSGQAMDVGGGKSNASEMRAPWDLGKGFTRRRPAQNQHL